MEPRVPLVRRLALLKFMFREAQDECRRRSPWNATAVLHLHDVVELFLALACDHHGKRVDQNFMEYFNALRGVADLRREGMERLNRARVDFKHYGNLPHEEDLDFFRVAVETFLEDATPKLFGGMKFAEISLVDVIACEAAKAHLAAAQVHWEAQRPREATESLALSYAELRWDHTKRNREPRFGRLPFDFGPDLSFARSAVRTIPDQEQRRLMEALVEGQERTRSAITSIALGIDYRKFVEFDMLTPSVHRMASGRTEVWADSTKPMTQLEFGRCFDFIIETALKLQEFDFAFAEPRTSARAAAELDDADGRSEAPPV